MVTPPEEEGFGEQVAVAIRDWIVERLQDYHANLGTDTRLMEVHDPALQLEWRCRPYADIMLQLCHNDPISTQFSSKGDCISLHGLKSLYSEPADLNQARVCHAVTFARKARPIYI